MSSELNILVISIDRLGSGWLGPYGNSGVETPAFNRLAAESTLCEFVLSDSYDLASVYRSYFTGLPSLVIAEPTWPSLVELAKAKGRTTCLITDSPEVAELSVCSEFQQKELFKLPMPERLARESNKTQAAQFFQFSATQVRQARQPALVWLHTHSLDHAWDAPYALRERLAAEDDPTPPKFVVPPSLDLPKDYDPDELLGIIQAYSAQVMLLDECLEWFLEAIDDVFSRSNTLLVVTSPHGLALGEHLKVGRAGDALRGEVLQVPLFVRFPNGDGRLVRLPGLFQTFDVFSTLASALGNEAQHGWGLDLGVAMREDSCGHEFAIARSPTELAVRTKDWFWRQSRTDEEPKAELYAKPDDRWEANEVSLRASEVNAEFAELAKWLEASQHALTKPEIVTLPS